VSVRTRLAWHFLLQTLALVAAVIVFAVAATLLYLNRTPTNGLTVARAADRLLSGAPAATAVAGDRVRVAAPTLAAVRRQGGWLQVLDRTGRVIYAYRAPAGLPGHYTPGELVYARLDPGQFGYAVYTWFATVHGQSLTWVFGAPKAALTSGRSRWFYLGLVGGIALLVAGAGLVFGWRLGTPLLHMLAWLEGMAEGRYDEPPRRKPGPATSQVYAPVLDTLRRTAEALRGAERQRERLETARDEWIAGVSHDLRTPLSSVKGYADLLAAPDHAWSEADVRRFGAEIGRRVTVRPPSSTR